MEKYQIASMKCWYGQHRRNLPCRVQFEDTTLPSNNQKQLVWVGSCLAIVVSLAGQGVIEPVSP